MQGTEGAIMKTVIKPRTYISPSKENLTHVPDAMVTTGLAVAAGIASNLASNWIWERHSKSEAGRKKKQKSTLFLHPTVKTFAEVIADARREMAAQRRLSMDDACKGKMKFRHRKS